MSQENTIKSRKPKLSAVIAIEESSKKRNYADLTKVYKIVQKPNLFNGFTRTWKSYTENEQDRPQEHNPVTENTITLLKTVMDQFGERLNTTATKDWGNTEAKADVILDNGEVLLSQVPVTHLLFIEKQINDIRALITKLPTLDPSRQWKFDSNTNTWIGTQEERTISTKKIQKGLVLAPATEHHPAQTQLITVDEPVGEWVIKHMSTALSARTIEVWLDNVSELERAVKTAREEANSIQVDKKNVGRKILKYIFKGIDKPGAS
jgi:hypothetical protein